MKKIRVRTDGKAITSCKQVIFVISISLILFPCFIAFGVDQKFNPISYKLLEHLFVLGYTLFIFFGLSLLLLSRNSPSKFLKIRKKLILFTRQFTKTTDDGAFKHSVEWQYSFKDNKLIIELFANGLLMDKAKIGQELSEYLRKNLLKFELTDRACYTFGKTPKRLNGKDLLYNDELKTIPIYDDVSWNVEEAECPHMLILAPSGAGKTAFLNYIASSLLKQHHNIYVVDAKNTNFGAMFDLIRKTATTVDDIIQMLNMLVESMEHDYAKHFSSETVGMGANFKTLGLPANVLIFDEVLSALDAGDKKQKAEMERLLKLLALKGRMAGYILVLTSQRLLSTDLPKAITEQCQVRIILGAHITEELFHLAMGCYKKDLATAYRGGLGKGYAITPQNGLSYIETPWMDFSPAEFRDLILTFKKENTPYGTGN